MARFLPVAFALAASAGAWTLAGSDRFDLVLCLGASAVAGGLWTLAQPLSKPMRVGVAVVAFLTLPATTAFVMSNIPGRFTPYSLGWNRKDLADLLLPPASEAIFDPLGEGRLILSGDRLGQLVFRGEVETLADYRQLIAHWPDRELLLRVDKDWPYRPWAWLLDFARQSGRRRVYVGACKYVSWQLEPREIALLGASTGHPDWPESEFALPLDSPVSGGVLRIVGIESAQARWGPRGEIRIRRPTRVDYVLGERVTSDIGEAGRWIRAGEVGSIDPRADVPMKFVVAILNRFAMAHRTLPALAMPRPPTDRECQMILMPFPEEE